ncbi:hypothetical protein LQZ19_00540, partial [Treponema primitia]
ALKKISREREHWARTMFREKAAMDYNSGMYNAYQKGREEARLVIEEKARLALEEKARVIEEKDRVIEENVRENQELRQKLRDAGLE